MEKVDAQNKTQNKTLSKKESSSTFADFIPSPNTFSRTFSGMGFMNASHASNLPLTFYPRPELTRKPAFNWANYEDTSIEKEVCTQARESKISIEVSEPSVEDKQPTLKRMSVTNDDFKEPEPKKQKFKESQPSVEVKHPTSELMNCVDDDFNVPESRKQKSWEPQRLRLDIGTTPEKMRGNADIFKTPEPKSTKLNEPQKRKTPFDGLERNLNKLWDSFQGPPCEVGKAPKNSEQKNKGIDGQYALPASSIMDFFDVLLNGNVGQAGNLYKMRVEACNKTNSTEPTSIKLKIAYQGNFTGQDNKQMKLCLMDELRHHLGEDNFNSLVLSYGENTGTYYAIEFNPVVLCKLTNELDALPNKIRLEDRDVRNQRIHARMIESKLGEMRQVLEANNCPYTEDLLAMYKIRADFDTAFNYDKELRLALTTDPNLKINIKTGLFDAEQRYACFLIYVNRNPDVRDKIVSIFPGEGNSEKCSKYMAYCLDNDYYDLVGGIDTVYSFNGDEIGG
jgi:hypothetical protein